MTFHLSNRLLFGCMAATALLVSACATKKKTETAAAKQPTVTIKTQATSTGSSATATIGPSKKEAVKKYSEFITPKTTIDKGLFTAYKQDGKYFLEIPDSLLGREMLVITRFVKTPAGMKGRAYGGEQLNDQVWQWQKHDKQVMIHVPSYSIRADSTSDMFASVRNSNLPAVLAAFDIKATSKDSSGVIIDVTEFYNGDIAALGLPEAAKKQYKITLVDNSRSYIDTIKSFPINTEVRTVKTYRSAGSPTDQSTAAMTFELNTSMLLLPKTPMKPRIMDSRVGYFGQRQVDYGRPAQKAEETAYIHRWRLEPKDEAAYARGELVEPKKPIVFYIDPATPKKWVPYLVQGVNDWQKAFEAAGFKNAVYAKPAPTPKEDPEFSTEDARYSVIRYFASDVMNAYGPHVSDPRSGEIMESHIGWYHNVMNLLRNWYLIQTAAVNPDSRHAKFSDEQMGQLVRFVSSHEVGHTLGLPHNFGSSYAYPVDSLRSPSFTSTHGTAPSIMDYARFNYIAQPGDGVKRFYPQIGEYDKWAVKWGYSYFPGNKNEEQEKDILNEWTLKNAGKPQFYYGRQGTSLDPRLQSEDLGDNAIKASEYGIANLKRILPNLEKWSYVKGEEYNDEKELYYEVLGQFNRYMGHVATNVGGMNENFKTYEQKGAVYSYVNKQRQRDAVLFFNRNLFATPTWMLNNTVLSKFDNGVAVARIKSIQANVVNNLLTAPRLARMYDNEIKYGKGAYSVASLMSDMSNGIFSKGRPDAFKRNLQRAYVERLSEMLVEDFKGFPGIAPDMLARFGMTPVDVTLSDIRPMVRAELKRISSLANGGSDAMTRAHFADLKMRIVTALDPRRPIVNVSSAPSMPSFGTTDPTFDPLKPDMDCFPKTEW